MAGYLGQLGQIGMRGEDRASGFGLLARDVTALEENDRGWENLPPWGYARNRPQDNAPPASLAGWLEMSRRGRGTQGEWLELPRPRGQQAGHPVVLVQSRGRVSGLGACCTGCASGHGCVSGLSGLGNAAVSADAMEAASAIREAILSTGVTGTSLDSLRMPDYSLGYSYLSKVTDGNVAEAIQGYAYGAEEAIRYLIEYGDDEGVADEKRAKVTSFTAGLKSIVDGQAPAASTGEAYVSADRADAVREYVHKDDQALSWLEQVAGSGVGEGIISAGAFTSGVTGINRDAIMDEARRSDIDVGRLVKAGEDARDSVLSMGKYAVYIGVAVVAYLGAKKAGLV